MTIQTNAYATYGAVGDREDLTNVIYNISPTETPFMTAIGKSKAKAVKHEWQTDALAAANTSNAQLEGDVVAGSAAAPTTRLSNICQISSKDVTVTGTQDAVGKGERSSETAYQMAKRAKELKRDMEAILTSNQAAGGPDLSGAQSVLGGIAGSNPALNPATAYLGQEASTASINPYLSSMFSAAAQPVEDAVNAQFGLAGCTGSGADQQELTRNLGDLAANIYGSNYNSAVQNQMAAANAIQNAYSTGVGQNLSAASDLGNLNLGGYNAQLGAVNTLGNLSEDQANRLLSAVAGTLSALQRLGIPKMVLVGPLPYRREYLPKILERSAIATHRIPETLPDSLHRRFDEPPLQSFVSANGVIYVSPLQIFCKEGACLARTGRDPAGVLAWDYAHLSETGAQTLIRSSQKKILGNLVQRR